MPVGDDGGMHALDEELGGCLRAWRARLAPADAGLPAGGRRRVPGLRREEVAGLAGVALDYLARLEQGRAPNPSPSVLASLARALRLSVDERSHLYRLAGHAVPSSGTIDRHIAPGVQRLLDRMEDIPVLVVDAASTIVAANRLACALVGDISAAMPWRERNIAWRQFNERPSRFVHSAEQRARAQAGTVAELHEALGRYPHDPQLRELVEELRARSASFAALWERHPVARAPARRKTFRHPEVGEITLDCDVLTVQGGDLSVVVYTPAPGTPDAEALALLGAIGLQAFAPAP
jgi:transcriptional regulator with XRE-family HTH domain